MGRLDINRQQEFEPKRISFAKKEIEKIGFKITFETSSYLQFDFKNHPVKIYPYSGWFTGKTVVDGRGIEKLLKQITA